MRSDNLLSGLRPTRITGLLHALMLRTGKKSSASLRSKNRSPCSRLKSLDTKKKISEAEAKIKAGEMIREEAEINVKVQVEVQARHRQAVEDAR